MKFMLIFFGNEDEWMAMSEDERGQAGQRIGAWYGEQFQAGRIVSGCKLDGKASARTVQLGPAGHSEEPVLSDGPFFNAEKSIGAYAIIDVPDMETAIGIAESWPGGGGVEVRVVTEE
jgi:hypothetical protein